MQQLLLRGANVESSARVRLLRLRPVRIRVQSAAPRRCTEAITASGGGGAGGSGGGDGRERVAL